jgi:hypothetical protein
MTEKVRIKIDMVLNETAKAILISKDGKHLWIPSSQVREIHRTDPPELVMEVWIAKKNGLI